MALLIYAGSEVEDIHDTLPTPVKPEGVTEANWTEYRKSKEKLNTYFLPQRSNDFALFELMKIKPMQDERTRNYATRLHKAAEKCDFENWSSSKMIKCLIISNMEDEKLRLSLLQKEMTLEDLLNKAEKKEDAVMMSRAMHDKEEVRKVNRRSTRSREERDDKQLDDSDEICYKCRHPRHHDSKDCPAVGKKCDFCKKMGHFAKCCLKRLVNTVTESTEEGPGSSDTDSDYDLVASISEKGSHKESEKLFQIKLNGFSLLWKPDTGSTKEIMTEQQFKQYQRQIGHKINLYTSNTNLYAFGSKERLNLMGQFNGTLRAGKSPFVPVF